MILSYNIWDIHEWIIRIDNRYVYRLRNFVSNGSYELLSCFLLICL